MRTPKCKRLAPGLYEVTGTEDADGKPYQVEQATTPDRTGWWVYDSRRREVSWHRTKFEAVTSIGEAG